MTVFVVGDGAVWRLDAEAQRAVAEGASWYDVAKLTGARQNWRRTRGHGWTGLPRALYATTDADGRVTLSVSDPRALLFSYADPAEIQAACAALTRIDRKNPQ